MAANRTTFSRVGIERTLYPRTTLRGHVPSSSQSHSPHGEDMDGRVDAAVIDKVEGSGDRPVRGSLGVHGPSQGAAQRPHAILSDRGRGNAIQGKRQHLPANDINPHW
eukprot:12552130-Alexandrium_andersonii.AAC.1